MAYKLKAQYTQNVWLVPYFTQKPSTLAQRPDNWFLVYKISDYKQGESSSLIGKRKPIKDEKRFL